MEHDEKVKEANDEKSKTMKSSIESKDDANIFKKMMMKTRSKIETSNLKSKMKKETPRKKAMKRFQQNEISNNEKSELLAMFEKMKAKKMPKVLEVKTTDEKEDSKVNDEKKVSTKDGKDVRNDEKSKKMKLNYIKKSEKPIEDRR